jgi:SAM-dependent methyltransferase
LALAPRLVDVEPFSEDAVRGAYDAVAVDYADAFGDDLARLPLDRDMLDAALAAIDGHGWVIEAGCGPAPAAGHLSGRARQMLGVDLSASMLTIAGARNPGLRRHPRQVTRSRHTTWTVCSLCEPGARTGASADRASRVNSDGQT